MREELEVEVMRIRQQGEIIAVERQELIERH